MREPRRNDGGAIGTEDHVRISYAASMKDLERGMDRLDNFIQQKK